MRATLRPSSVKPSTLIFSHYACNGYKQITFSAVIGLVQMSKADRDQVIDQLANGKRRPHISKVA